MRCMLCEEEIEPGVASVPICQNCSGESAAGPGTHPTEQQTRADLHREILASTARALAAARSEEMKAHSRLNEFLSRCIVPVVPKDPKQSSEGLKQSADDLKQSSGG